MSDMQFFPLPANLPIPQDDGACKHLRGMRVPDISLQSTSGGLVNLGRKNGLFALYAYPLTGKPNVALPAGWDEIPGARGCTPESCAFRNHHSEIRQFGAEVFGLSTQETEYQREVQARLHLPFDILSDKDFILTEALALPTFTTGSMRLLKRVTLIISSNTIEHVFYPIFPPDKHASEVVEYLKARNRSQ